MPLSEALPLVMWAVAVVAIIIIVDLYATKVLD